MEGRGLTTKQVMESYSRVFCTDDGMIVLSDILSQLRYFANQPSEIHPECIAVANTILSRCGLVSSGGNGVFMEGMSYAINLAKGKEGIDHEEEDDDV